MSAVFPNPPVDVDALMAPVTADTVNTVIINMLVTLGIRADLWPQEGALRSCMWAVSTAIAGFVSDRIAATKAGWLPTAAGAWLTWLAFYMYGVLRTAATFATGQVTLSNGGGGVFSFAPGTWKCQNTVTGQFYTNTTAIALAAGPGTSQVVSIQATTIGSVGNATPGQITTIVTGGMASVTCTNLGPVLGIDAQSDPSLQLACWNAIAANSAYGPAMSYAHAVDTATNSVTGSPVNINRYREPPPTHTNLVTIYVASPEGVPDPTDVAGVATQINAIARPPNIQVTVLGASQFTDADAITAYVRSTPGLDVASVQTAMTNAVAEYFEEYPIGGMSNGTVTGIFATGIEGAISAAWPGVFDVTGANDYAMTPNQVAVDNLTINVVLVAA